MTLTMVARTITTRRTTTPTITMPITILIFPRASRTIFVRRDVEGTVGSGKAQGQGHAVPSRSVHR